MNCPKCQEVLTDCELEKSLKAKRCTACGGHWLNFVNYLLWQQSSLSKVEHQHVSVEEDYSTNTKNALICPECIRIMLKYKTASDMPFTIDQCGHCHGIWFDGREWEMIKAHGLIHQVHLFFTEHWQNKVRRELSELRKEELLRQRFGDGVYHEVKRIKAWIEEQPQQRSIIAYLLNEEVAEEDN